ncbi:uncharacterized protein [Miscanthus floridulus]|uniref:uncharacterized protein isoform X2 n=1 Tax=Miscanthus floridulus TaxID=154761 RepID=UPI0034596923
MSAARGCVRWARPPRRRRLLSPWAPPGYSATGTHQVNPDLEMELKPQARPRPYQRASIRCLGMDLQSMQLLCYLLVLLSNLVALQIQFSGPTSPIKSNSTCRSDVYYRCTTFVSYVSCSWSDYFTKDTFSIQ